MQLPGVDLRAGPALLVGTRKGAFFLQPHTDRPDRWQLYEPLFLGHVVNHLVLDPRNGSDLLAAVTTGHLGPTLFRSTDAGRSFAEALRPPAFSKAKPGQRPRVLSHTFWLSPGHSSEAACWYAGSSPQGLWHSTDSGNTWQGVAGFNDHPAYEQRTEDPQAGTPDGPVLHSILIDPRDAAHMYLGLSGGGVYESTDHGTTWSALNQGLVTVGTDAGLVEPGAIEWQEVGPQHDPHLVQLHPADPDLLWQQNHCGIYRLQRPARTWDRVGRNMPADIGDIGFVVGLHPRDTQRCWVFPMDGTDVWPRTSPGGRPAVYMSADGGASWQRQDRGLPERGWLTVKRQGMAVADDEPVTVFFGTTGGELWAGSNGGEHWTCIARHLPEIYSVELGQIP